MRRWMLILAALPPLLLCRPAAAQEVVVDPTHIGVAVENTASSLEEMITMIEEMFSLNGKLDDLYGLAEKVSEVADRFKEVGYLVDMTETYNELLQRTYDYSSRIKEWAAEGDIYNYERELRYIYRCETQGIKLFEQYMNYFRSLKTTDADKAEKAEKTIEKMEQALEELTSTMDAAEQSRQIGESLADAATFLDRGLEVDDYTQTYRSLGDAEFAASAWIQTIWYLQALTIVFAVILAFIIYFRGQGFGNQTSAMSFMRVFIAAAVGWLILEMLNMVIQ